MLIDEFKNINSSRKELIKFGRTVGIAFLVIGVIISLISKSIHYIPFGIGVFLIIAALLVPVVLLPFHKLWMGLSVILGYISTRVILFVIYYVALTPIAFFGRLRGKDFINEKLEPEKESYWIKKDPADNKNENLKKQF